MQKSDIYASPRHVTNREDCFFYHTINLPGHGVIPGEWDLQSGIDKYLGRVSFGGKRVLDVGSASGFLSFNMERAGADVVSYDLSPDHCWDIVPFAGVNLTQSQILFRDAARRVNNGYWFCHRALQSRARMVHGTVYTIPEAIGPVDIVTVGSLLLHVRDPFLALQKALQNCRETAIVADLIPRRRFLAWLLRLSFQPQMTLLPRIDDVGTQGGWWYLSPEVVRRFLGVLGFEDTRIGYHTQFYKGSRRLLYTIVGKRTRPAPELPSADPTRAPALVA
jgi:SAM-dependent methyltransferase